MSESPKHVDSVATVMDPDCSLLDPDPVVCAECHQRWGWPRNIRYLNVAEAAKTIRPTTKETIVPYLAPQPGRGCPSICPDLFTRLQFARKKHKCCGRTLQGRSLVREIEYEMSTGVIYYDVRFRDDPNVGYARLISLNSWWWELSKCVGSAALGLFEMGITSSLIANLWTDPDLTMGSHHEAMLVRIAFTAGYGFACLSMLLLATHEARKEWAQRSQPRIGDITLLVGWVDQMKAFGSLTMLLFFGVDALVRDIVITLHPWKGVQPYAAIKSFGTRAHVVGYRNGHHFRIENKQGQNMLLPFKLIATFFIIFIKVWMAVRLESKFYTVWPIATSLCSFCYTSYKYAGLAWARRAFKKANAKMMAADAKGTPSNFGSSSPGASPTAGTPGGSDTLNLRPANEATPEGSQVVGGMLRGMSVMDTTKQEDHLQWREEEFNKRHFQLGVGSRTSPTCEMADCNRCGRDLLSDEQKADLEQAQPLEPGTHVRLVHGALENRAYSDARHGPLRYGEVGKVVEVATSAENYGARLLVEPLKLRRDGDDDACNRATYDDKALIGHIWESPCWWYEAAALQPTGYVKVQPREVVMQDLERTMAELQEQASKLQILLSATTGVDVVNVKMHLKEVLDPLMRLTDLDIMATQTHTRSPDGPGEELDKVIEPPNNRSTSFSGSEGQAMLTPLSAAEVSLQQVRSPREEDQEERKRLALLDEVENLRRSNERLQEEVQQLRSAGSPIPRTGSRDLACKQDGPTSSWETRKNAVPELREEKANEGALALAAPMEAKPGGGVSPIQAKDLPTPSGIRENIASNPGSFQRRELVTKMREAQEVMEQLRLQWWLLEHGIAQEVREQSWSLKLDIKAWRASHEEATRAALEQGHRTPELHARA